MSKTQDNNLVFAFTLAFVLHLVVIAVYDLTRDFGSDLPPQPRIVKIRLGEAGDEEIAEQKTPEDEIIIEQVTEQEFGDKIIEEKIVETSEKKLSAKKKRSKPRGSEYGNSTDADAISAPTYLDLLQVTVQERSAVPLEAAEKRQYGRAVLRLSFNRLGYVKKYSIIRSSGYEILDREALRVAQTLTQNPFPPAPQSFDRGRTTLIYDFPISFSEH